MEITAKEYEMIHLMECRKYEKCVPKCHFWGLCEDRVIPLVNINSAISVAEDIKKGVLRDEID